jgi:hypothetical protein
MVELPKTPQWARALVAAAVKSRSERRGARSCAAVLLLPEAVRQNPSVEAPFTMASTTIAAVTIRAPGMRWSSVMPRGFVHAPHAQI